MTVRANRSYLRAAAAGNLIVAALLLLMGVLLFQLALINAVLAIPCLYAGLLYLRALRTAEPALVVDQLGVHDSTDCLPGGLLRWEDIKGVREGRYNGGNALFIDLHDTDAYLNRFSPGARALLRLNLHQCGTPALFSQRCVTTAIGDIRECIESELERRQAYGMVIGPKGAAVVAPVGGVAAAPAGPRHWWTSVAPEERAAEPIRLGRGGDAG